MSVVFKHSKYLIAALVLFNAINTIAQSKLDSIIEVTTTDIYKNPDRVIKVCDSIYNSPESSIEDKARVLMLISDAYSSKRDYQKSLKYFSSAIALSNKVQDINFQISISGKTAVKYQQLKVYDKAIESLDKCDSLISLQVSKGIKKYTNTQAINNVVRGFIYKDQLNCNIAIDYFKKGISGFKNINSASVQANLSIANYNMGNCYILLADYKAAKSSFFEAIKNAEVIDAKSLKAFAQKGLAEVYGKEGEYKKALEVLQQALQTSKNVGDLILNRAIYDALATNYLAINEWGQYQKYNKLYLENQSIIIESERRSISDSIDEATQVHHEKLNSIKTCYYLVLSIISVLILTLGFLLYRYQKRSLKSIESLNLEVKRIKSTLKKQ